MGKRISLVAVMFVVCMCAAVFAQYPGWSLPQGGKDEKSPLTSSAALLQKGKTIFVANCQGCHGPEGKGNGPRSDPEHPAADLTDPFRTSINTDGALYYKIWNGHLSQPSFSPTYDMPAFSGKLTKEQVWTVVEYVKTLRKAS